MMAFDDLRAAGSFASLQVVPPPFAGGLLPVGAAPLGGDLSYHGGMTIAGPFLIYNVYLDTFPDNAADFDSFVTSMAGSTYYRDPDGSTGSGGIFGGGVHLVSGLSGVVPAAVLHNQIDTWVRTGILPTQPSPAVVYNIILPPTITVSMDGLQTCRDICGYHEITPGGTFVNVLSDTTCGPCHGGFTSTQARQIVAAHEYVEWRSNPTGQGWWNDTTGLEIADECNFEGAPWGPQEQWQVTRYWQNGDGCFVPVYFPVDVTPDLYCNPTRQIRDAQIVVRTRSLLEAGNEPVPEEIVRDLFVERWIPTEVLGGKPPVILVADEALQQNLGRDGDLVILSLTENSEEWEGFRHEYVNTDLVVELEFLTSHSRQRVWNLQAEARRIIYEFIIALVPYHSLGWRAFIPEYEQGPRKFHGTAAVLLQQQGLPALLRYVGGQEYPAAAPDTVPQKVLP